MPCSCVNDTNKVNKIINETGNGNWNGVYNIDGVQTTLDKNGNGTHNGRDHQNGELDPTKPYVVINGWSGDSTVLPQDTTVIPGADFMGTRFDGQSIGFEDVFKPDQPHYQIITLNSLATAWLFIEPPHCERSVNRDSQLKADKEILPPYSQKPYIQKLVSEIRVRLR